MSAGGAPPGLARKDGMPPGLAMKLGRPRPRRIYVAFDPRRDDRAWFLIENRWVERADFDVALRLEVRQSLRLPPSPLPPVPPPSSTCTWCSSAREAQLAGTDSTEPSSAMSSISTSSRGCRARISRRKARR